MLEIKELFPKATFIKICYKKMTAVSQFLTPETTKID